MDAQQLKTVPPEPLSDPAQPRERDVDHAEELSASGAWTSGACCVVLSITIWP